MAADTQVAVIGGGVVGCAVARAMALGGVEVQLLEAESELATGASGANSGILHTGFDSPPGELETHLILHAARLRTELAGELGAPQWRCGARLLAADDAQRAAVRRVAENARANGVPVREGAAGALEVPGESVTDPVAFVAALARAAQGAGALIRLRARVVALARAHGGDIELGLEGGEQLRARAVVNCAGLHADELARMGGEDPVHIYPRKGEFLVLEPPREGPLREILLPVPSAAGKGVLVFPTLDGHIIAGPTARDREDKHDWSVEADAAEQILGHAVRMYPPLAGAAVVASYAGLRPAGRGRNYVIEHSRALPGLIHAAAIRSTGLSASLAIGEHVAAMLARARSIELMTAPPARATGAAPARARARSAGAGGATPWWERAARRSAGLERA